MGSSTLQEGVLGTPSGNPLLRTPPENPFLTIKPRASPPSKNHSENPSPEPSPEPSQNPSKKLEPSQNPLTALPGSVCCPIYPKDPSVLKTLRQRKISGVRKRAVSKTVVWRMFPCTENRKEGTKNGRTMPKTGTRVQKTERRHQKPGTRVRSPKPPFYKATLCFLSKDTVNYHSVAFWLRFPYSLRREPFFVREKCL